MTEEEILKQINKSGFPFQLKIENEIRKTQSQHNWSIASRENPWTNNKIGSLGFADIVLKHDQFSTFRLVIECKRVKADDARQLRWIFLLPDQDLMETSLTSCFEVEGIWMSTEQQREKNCLMWKVGIMYDFLLPLCNLNFAFFKVTSNVNNPY